MGRTKWATLSDATISRITVRLAQIDHVQAWGGGLMGQLTVVAHGNETWSVKDADGGTWRPDDEAWHEIRESSDQRATALRICQEEPMRGTWHQ